MAGLCADASAARSGTGWPGAVSARHPSLPRHRRCCGPVPATTYFAGELRRLCVMLAAPAGVDAARRLISILPVCRTAGERNCARLQRACRTGVPAAACAREDFSQGSGLELLDFPGGRDYRAGGGRLALWLDGQSGAGVLLRGDRVPGSAAGVGGHSHPGGSTAAAGAVLCAGSGGFAIHLGATA